MSGLVHAEDLVVGTEYDLGAHTVTLAEIQDFSRAWDPQPFHVDDDADSWFDGTIASGMHSLAILQRLSVVGVFHGWAILAGRRVRDARFRAPVRPGMTLHGSMRIDEVAVRDDEKALVTVSMTLTADGTTVLSAVHEFYVFRRTRAQLTDMSTR
jgi:acyl dehydratase